MELVSVTSVNDIGLASIIKGVLEQAGIEAVIHGSGAEDAFPPGMLGELRILVPEDELAMALDVLDQYETSPDLEEDEHE
jgi:hypothetical protein